MADRQAAVSGVATATTSAGGGAQLTILPGTASGTASIDVQPIGGSGFEAAKDASGSAITGVSLAAQVTYRLLGNLVGVRVTSSNTADTFDIVVTP